MFPCEEVCDAGERAKWRPHARPTRPLLRAVPPNPRWPGRTAWPLPRRSFMNTANSARPRPISRPPRTHTLARRSTLPTRTICSRCGCWRRRTRTARTNCGCVCGSTACVRRRATPTPMAPRNRRRKPSDSHKQRTRPSPAAPLLRSRRSSYRPTRSSDSARMSSCGCC